MKFRLNKKGEKVFPHAIKLEEKYQHIFDWFKKNEEVSKTDVIRTAVKKHFTSCGGSLSEIKDKCSIIIIHKDQKKERYDPKKHKGKAIDYGKD